MEHPTFHDKLAREARPGWSWSSSPMSAKAAAPLGAYSVYSTHSTHCARRCSAACHQVQSLDRQRWRAPPLREEHLLTIKGG